MLAHALRTVVLTNSNHIENLLVNLCLRGQTATSHCLCSHPYTPTGTGNRSFHVTTRRYDLMEFFDDEKNWNKEEVVVGRPWRVEELRLKNNVDLWKLWYVLLKERNMVMTMQEEYKRAGSTYPSPARLEKVEESMENLVDVIQERDSAYNTLEHGEDITSSGACRFNLLGLPFWRKFKEYPIPWDQNYSQMKYTRPHGKWVSIYLKLHREKTMNSLRKRHYRRVHKRRELRRQFPDADLSELDAKIAAGVPKLSRTLTEKFTEMNLAKLEDDIEADEKEGDLTDDNSADGR